MGNEGERHHILLAEEGTVGSHRMVRRSTTGLDWEWGRRDPGRGSIRYRGREA